MSEPESKPSDLTPAPPPKPKRKSKAIEIVPLPPQTEIRLGSLAIADPKEMIHRAAELASALADIIHKQKDRDGKPTLYVMIQGRKYVRAEGWTTLGAMMGVVPIEDFCDPLPEGGGYKAKVKLVRLNDGMQVGGASAICKLNEPGWNKDAAATHSKAITRATGKAFRLSFAWIMKLAGFEPTPADELFEVEGSEEAAQQVVEEKTGKEVKKAEKKVLQEAVFVTWPESHNGNKALLMGQTAIRKFGLEAYIRREMGGDWNDRDGGYYVAASKIPEFKRVVEGLQCPIMERNPYANGQKA